MTDRKSHLYLLLSVFFVGNAFLAELTGAKIFSAGDLLTHGVWFKRTTMACIAEYECWRPDMAPGFHNIRHNE